MNMRAIFSILLISLVTACGGGGDGGKAIPFGEPVAPNFSDTDPVDFRGQRPSGYPVHGIDAARFQKSINWPQARRNGVNFAFLKATEGGDLLDPMFKSHWRGAGKAGVARGAYHSIIFARHQRFRPIGLSAMSQRPKVCYRQFSTWNGTRFHPPARIAVPKQK